MVDQVLQQWRVQNRGHLQFLASDSGANDGHTLTLNGQTFNGGFGVPANSDLAFNLAGIGYKAFAAAVGVDDEVGNNGSVIFQVFVDGVKKFLPHR